ncbi:C80 family cysteine peptidase, partial [Bathymodiolus thermophilus thioautotrophic gill symbiont]
GAPYTPTGDTRINFVDHGTNLSQEGAQSLANKAQTLHQTYSNSNTNIKRIALVGCDTDGVNQSLAKVFAKTIYRDTPALKNAEVTGRKGQVQVNKEGTKTMTTGGSKTIYSWNEEVEGNIKERTETVKSHSDDLENPLGKFDDEIKAIEVLLKKESIDEDAKEVLTDALEEYKRARKEFTMDRYESGIVMVQSAASKLQDLKECQDVEIKKQLDRILDFTHAQISAVDSWEREQLSSGVNKFLSAARNEMKGWHFSQAITRYKRFLQYQENHPRKEANLQKMEEQQDKLLKGIKETAWYMLDKVDHALTQENLEIEKIEPLEGLIRFLKNHLDFFDDDMQDAIKTTNSSIAQARLQTWGQDKIVDSYEAPPIGYDARVIVQLEDDRVVAESVASLAGKHFKQSTLIQMNRDGSYRTIHGPKLEDIKGNVKVVFDGHGDRHNKTMGGRSADDIVEHVILLRGKLTGGATIATVAIKGCDAGPDYGKDVLIGLNENNLRPRVTSRNSVAKTGNSGRQSIGGLYHFDENKTAWQYDENNKIVTVAPYSDEQYHMTVSVDKNGLLSVVQTHENKPWETFEGELKVRVWAGDYDDTLSALKLFQGKLKEQGASMKQINIKTGADGVDWADKFNVFTYAEHIRKMSDETDANVLSHSVSDFHEGTAVVNYKDAPSHERVALTPEYAIRFTDDNPSNLVSFSYSDYSHPVFDMSTTPDANIRLSIDVSTGEYINEEVLLQLQSAQEAAGKFAISGVEIITEESDPVLMQDYKNLVDYLSKELKVKVEVCRYRSDNEPDRELWLSKNPKDSKIKVHHLAETTSHQNTPIHNWSDLSQEQIDKLAAESQKPKPSLANHDHQVLIQTEADDNVKDNTLRLASKHPTQTTIVQMQKDGTYKVVYGAKLENITGRVKMVAVGYGREKNGVQTLGGRNESELSDNILTLKRDLNPTNTTIGRTSLVACNLESNNLTDNPDSQYGKQVIQRLHQGGINGDLSVRSS